MITLLAGGKTKEKLEANMIHLRPVGRITKGKCHLAVLLAARIKVVNEEVEVL